MTFVSIRKNGFTLLEVITVMAIIILLSVVFLANYRAGEKQLALKRSVSKLAQDLRKAQAMAMSSKKFNDVFPKGGYGIYFKIDANSYILFADCNDNREYDLTGSAFSCQDATTLNPYPEKIEEILLEKGIKISTLSPSSQGTLLITFFPPDPVTRINPSANLAIITLTLNTQSLTVSLNTAGLIDVD